MEDVACIDRQERRCAAEQNGKEVERGSAKKQFVACLSGCHPNPTTGSMLSICADVGRPWLSTCLSEAICRFRARCRSSSVSSLTRRRARLTLSAHDGATGSSVLVAERLAIPIVSPIAQPFCDVATASTIATSPPARSWNARTRRSRLVLGGVPGCQPHTRHIRRPVPAATRAVSLRNGLSDSPQATRWHGPL